MRGTSTALFRVKDVLPRAYVVGSTEVIAGDTAIARLLAPEFDARTTAILEEPVPAGVDVQPGATGSVRWVERQVDELLLQVTADRPGLLMLLDNYYPAWQATVDDIAVPILRANYTFRAVPIPAGEHMVRFRYRPASVRTGAVISLATLALLLAVTMAGAWRERRVRTPAVA